MRVSMIMAMDSARLIGQQGGLPWKISSDLKYFKRVTMGKPLIMGRVTFDSLERALPGRPNIVLSRDEAWQAEGVETTNTLEQAFNAARKYDASEMMVIGGASLCKIAIPHTERLYLTVIDHQFPDGDTWLDSFHWADWTESSKELHDETDQGGYKFTYYVLERAT